MTLRSRRTEMMTTLARRWTDTVVRSYAVAALATAGLFGAADALASLEEINDEASLGRARRALGTVVTQVLDAPSNRLGNNALLAVIAAREAVAIASGPIEDAQLSQLEVTLAVAASAADGGDEDA